MPRIPRRDVVVFAVLASVCVAAAVVPTAVCFARKRKPNSADVDGAGTDFINKVPLIRIHNLDLRSFESENPANNLKFRSSGFKTYQDPKLVGVFRDTFYMCKRENIQSDFDNFDVYALDNCVRRVEGDKVLKHTLHRVAGRKHGKLYIHDGNSVGGIYDVVPENHLGRVGVADFANYYDAGGKPMNGSKAQEENICRITDLANRLWYKKVYKSFFAVNKYLKKRNMIEGYAADHRALYLRGVWWLKEDTDGYERIHRSKRKRMDVVAVAAPDFSKELRGLNRGSKQYKAKSKELSNKHGKLIKDRIRLAFETAIENDIDTFGFGAFGCGAFGCDPTVVAHLSREILINEGYLRYFNNVVITIPSKNSDNYKAFENELGRYACKIS